MRQKKSENQVFTYQTRLILNEDASNILFACAALMNKVEHCLFADIVKGHLTSELKSSYLKKHQITARHFNANRIILEGKISSIKELQKQQVAELKQRILSLEVNIKKLEKKKAHFQVHQKKRRLATLQSRLQKLEQNLSQKKTPLCFGSNKLFRKQFNLQENQYLSHDEWKKDWQQKRNKSFFLIGSKDETSGNQSCVASTEGDSISLRIRLPDALKEHGKYLVVNGLKFSYGQEAIIAAITSHLEGTDPVAISYRFLLDEIGWRVFVSVTIKEPSKVTRSGLGVIGVDINADHIAVVETDRYGNPIDRKSFPLCTYGKTRHQTLAFIGDVSSSIIEWCVRSKKPVVIEKLKFSDKKCSLREIGNVRYARMLSSFAYSAIISMIKSKSFRCGVHVNEVNPAYTSIIGRIKFAKRYGFSVHESAALCIGRRCLGASERLPRHQSQVPDGRGGHVTLSLPVRNRDRHVWSSWRIAQKRLLKLCLQHISRRNKAILKPDKSCLL
jgi:IS605 OrfB family transposase